jgi:hypothetical protein
MDILHYLEQEEQEEQEAEKPPSPRPRPAQPWRVAVIANVKGETVLPSDAPPDAGAEFDRRETIQAIQDAIETDGHTTQFLSADYTLLDTLREYRPNICFNIAEGIMGDGREAQVPALLEMLRIPYTASRVLANAVGLDKTMTKRIWRDHGIATAPFQEFDSGSEPLDAELEFPLFVKPAREGTGMGMDERSIVRNETELRERVSWVVRSYHQPALVEAFLPGREFTGGVLGRGDSARWARSPEAAWSPSCRGEPSPSRSSISRRLRPRQHGTPSVLYRPRCPATGPGQVATSPAHASRGPGAREHHRACRYAWSPGRCLSALGRFNSRLARSSP